MFYIKRSKGFEGNFPSFAAKDAAMRYIVNNTGVFDTNEIICIINFETQETVFVRMELTVIATVI
jgi:hypothetical protein